jgi:sodium-dependent dicarboxylate transporter 2/3/5
MFDTKLAEVIGTGLLQLSGATSVWGITLGAIFIAILVSETSSNTASANMVVPVMIVLAMAAGRGGQPDTAGHRGNLRGKLGLHAPGIYAA